jgi:predicted nucleotidyltransferase component of viral defense system
MSGADLTNLPASIRQRLLNLSRSRGESFNLILQRYALERLLYRLDRSGHSQQFILKGALLFALWQVQGYRPTRDLDLLGYGDSSPEALLTVFREICAVDVEADGLSFAPQTIRIREIREDQEYGGQRVELEAFLGKARISIQVDIGFGDVVTPAPAKVEYPSLLGLPAPHLRAYPKETVIAEKLHALVVLGILNSRMKDFYDLWVMSREFSFAGPLLTAAVQATFARRQTELPQGIPVALTAAFVHDAIKTTQWQAFLSRSQLGTGGRDFPGVMADLHGFLMPLLEALARKEDLPRTWPAGGPWTAVATP